MTDHAVLPPMQSASRSRYPRRLGISWLVAAFLVLAGCTALESMLPGSGPVVIVRLEGGMCPEGLCQAAWELRGDGRILTLAEPPEEIGRAKGEATTALVAAIQVADFTAIRSRPFTGTCPTAYDGQEIVFEFHAPSGVQRVSSCEVEIDWTSPLFAATVAALSSVLPLPTTP